MHDSHLHSLDSLYQEFATLNEVILDSCSTCISFSIANILTIVILLFQYNRPQTHIYS